MVELLNRALQKLEQLNQFPDFNNYLIFVLTSLKSEGMYVHGINRDTNYTSGL